MPRGRKKTTTKSRSRKTNKANNTNASRSVDNMKYEIASEFGVNLGANASSRDNGLVGGEMTKRLVAKAKNKKSTRSKTTKNNK